VLAWLGFAMVISFMWLIMSRRLSPMVALTLVPIAFGLLAGTGAVELGAMMLDGVRKLAPTGVMLLFAILYFGLMIDAGLFDPVVSRIVRLVHGDPLKVVVGTAALALFVSLDGDGSTTYMITVASMLPLYRRLGVDALALTCVTMLASGVMNLTPWGGPLARAASALHVDPADVFVPMLPAMAVGVLGVLGIAWLIGRRERARLGTLTWPAASAAPGPAGTAATHAAVGATTDAAGAVGVVRVAGAAIASDTPTPADPFGVDPQAAALRRPRLLWVNGALTLALMTGLLSGRVPLPVLFMVACALALVINYPDVALQRERLAEHARNAIAVVSVIFAAGIFTGILSGTGMVEAMSQGVLAIVPPALGPYLASITAVLSLPFTFFISNDAFYFGVLPILAEAAQAYGITPVEMARASLIGQPVHLLSPLVPSTYLLVGLAGVEFGDHQRYALKWATLVCLLMLVAALAFGIFPLGA
jgi:CitMHS family citrate-Mg2+:H+ or citrate-Ca2+:H+ symporter